MIESGDVLTHILVCTSPTFLLFVKGCLVLYSRKWALKIRLCKDVVFYELNYLINLNEL